VEDTGEAIPPQVNVRLDWSAVDACPTQHVNQIIAQVGPAQGGIPDGVYIGLGSVPPPLILAVNEAERAEMVAVLSAQPIAVTVHGRFHMSRAVLGALIKSLQTTADQYDAVVQHSAGEQPPEIEAPK
jgi:hypothetical protein